MHGCGIIFVKYIRAQTVFQLTIHDMTRMYGCRLTSPVTVIVVCTDMTISQHFNKHKLFILYNENIVVKEDGLFKNINS